MAELQIDKIIRSARQTIGLQITSDARLIVRAPLFTPENHIHKLIKRKESWIKAKQELFKKQQESLVARKFIPGENFLFLGQHYSLVLVENQQEAVVVLNGALNIASRILGQVKEHLELWYRSQALDYMTQKVNSLSQIHGLRCQSIRISKANTRWGSCGPQGSLNFTWRLMMAPVRVVDYVIVHELMHLKQKNHSHKFWEEVARLVPDYRQDERWLKTNGHLLAWPE